MPKATIGVRDNLGITVEGDDETLLRGLAFWDSVPATCPVRMGQDEVCGHAIRFTIRTPTAKSGPNAGQKFTYYGLECSGSPQHEAQISQRNDKVNGGFFIRSGNRRDGKPNWRRAFDGDYDDEDPQSDSDGHPHNFGSDSERSNNPDLLNGDQLKEIRRVGLLQGLIEGDNDAALIADCTGIYGKSYRLLTKAEAIEYRKTLMAL